MPIGSDPEKTKVYMHMCGVKREMEEAERAARGPCAHKHTDMGYGLAGGGLGVYEYCNDCGQAINKTQDQS